MNAEARRRFPVSDWLFALPAILVLLICLFYVLVYALVSPAYSGISINGAWAVTHIDSCDAHPGWCNENAGGLQSLRVGDRLLVIGGLAHSEYLSDQRLVPFEGYGPGDSVALTYRRGGEDTTVRWRMPVVTPANRLLRLVGLVLCLPFWLIGSGIGLFLRPRDARWRLLVAFNYLTAVWVVVGVVSLWRVAGSSLVVHALTWLLAPVCVHLHLEVPETLVGTRSRPMMYTLYAVSIVMATLELLQYVPTNVCYLALSVAIPVSLGLLLWRLRGRASPAGRVAAGLMLAGLVVAFGPGIVLWLVPGLLDASPPTDLVLAVSTLSIPALPIFYAYAIYKRRLGGLEIRANRALATYTFVVLYVTALVVVFLVGNRQVGLSRDAVVFGVIASAVSSIAAVPFYLRYRRWVARVAYGAKHSPDQLLRTFAPRIAALLEQEALAAILAEEVAPSLLIRQSALCLIDGDDLTVLFAQGVGGDEMPESAQQAREWHDGTGGYAAASQQVGSGRAWVRLAIPLKSGDRTIGLWLLGRRDPDDYYPRDDVALLNALGGQVAVAVENMRLFNAVELHRREVTELSARLMTVREEERKALSDELHDRVGQNLAALNIGFTVAQKEIRQGGHLEPSRLKEWLGLLEETSKIIRELTTQLRTSVLDDYGLPAALEWQAAQLAQRTGVSATVQADGSAPPLDTAKKRALFRIAQEALLNVAKHAEATEVVLKLERDGDVVRLVIEDDGVGLDAAPAADEERDRGWGMLFMRECALSAGGNLVVRPRAGRGTRVEVEVPL